MSRPERHTGRPGGGAPPARLLRRPNPSVSHRQETRCSLTPEVQAAAPFSTPDRRPPSRPHRGPPHTPPTRQHLTCFPTPSWPRAQNAGAGGGGGGDVGAASDLGGAGEGCRGESQDEERGGAARAPGAPPRLAPPDSDPAAPGLCSPAPEPTGPAPPGFCSPDHCTPGPAPGPPPRPAKTHLGRPRRPRRSG